MLKNRPRSATSEVPKKLPQSRALKTSLKSLESKVVDFRPEEEKAAKSVNLVKKGFPRRHVSRVPEMVGPSKDKADDLLATILRGDSLIVLAGNRGPGKTQMATFWATKFKRPRYFKAIRLIEAFRGRFSDDRKTQEASELALNNARKCEYLVIDELSELSWSDFESQQITALLDERYDDELSTVLITNTVEDEEIQSEIGYSAYSRAKETGGVVKCDWPSYRKI